MFNEKSEKEQEEIKKLINRLLAVNFLIREKERALYQTARLHRASLENFFVWLGWDFVLDERHECVFVVSKETALRRNLGKEESIWLLVLRLIYEEKRRDLSLSEFPLTTVHEIRTKYAVFSLPFVNKTRLLALIRLAEQYNLCDAVDEDPAQDDCRIRLFHTLLHVLSGYSVEAMVAKIESYDTAAAEEEFYEMAPETETD